MSKDGTSPLSPGHLCLRPVHRRRQDSLDRGLTQILLPFQTFYSLLWESQELKLSLSSPTSCLFFFFLIFQLDKNIKEKTECPHPFDDLEEAVRGNPSNSRGG